MINLRIYKKGDVYQLSAKEKLSNYATEQVLEHRALHANSFAHTFVVDQKPVAVVGLTFWWPGMAELWALVSKDVDPYAIYFHKKSLKAMEFYQKHMNIIRYHVTVKETFVCGQMWAERLGFKREGFMPKFGPDGSDYILYGKVF